MALKLFTASIRRAIEKLNKEQLSLLCDDVDATCTSGSDNDGSTGYEIFVNGFELAQKAGSQDVFHEELDLDGGHPTIFLIGTEESVIVRIQKVLDENPSEDA